MRSNPFRLFLALATCVSAATGQQAKKKSASPPAKTRGQQSSTSQAPVMTMPQPGPEMQKFVNAFSGTWSIKVKYEPSKSMPNGGVGQGEEVWRPGPGGLSLVEGYQEKNASGEVSGFGVMWWDEKAQGCRTVWCENTTAVGCWVSTTMGKQGSQLVFIDGPETTGKKFTTKEVFADITPTSFTQTVEEGESGGQLKPVLTIHATKLTKAMPPGASSNNSHRP